MELQCSQGLLPKCFPSHLPASAACSELTECVQPGCLLSLEEMMLMEENGPFALLIVPNKLFLEKC